MGVQSNGGGTGNKLTKATVVICGVAALVASLLSFVYVCSTPDALLEAQLTRDVRA